MADRAVNRNNEYEAHMGYDDTWGHCLIVQTRSRRRRRADRKILTDFAWDLIGGGLLVVLVALIGALWAGSP